MLGLVPIFNVCIHYMKGLEVSWETVKEYTVGTHQIEVLDKVVWQGIGEERFRLKLEDERIKETIVPWRSVRCSQNIW